MVIKRAFHLHIISKASTLLSLSCTAGVTSWWHWGAQPVELSSGSGVSASAWARPVARPPLLWSSQGQLPTGTRPQHIVSCTPHLTDAYWKIHNKPMFSTLTFSLGIWVQIYNQVHLSTLIPDLFGKKWSNSNVSVSSRLHDKFLIVHARFIIHGEEIVWLKNLVLLRKFCLCSPDLYPNLFFKHYDGILYAGGCMLH